MRVSVVIPTYNRAHVVCRAIDSVLNQTYRPFEIIVVDDGSNDNTKQILRTYGTRIKYKYRENSGKPGIARNTGLKYARGNWIAFLDSDDVWLPNKLELQVILVERANVELGLVFSAYEKVKKRNEITRPTAFIDRDSKGLAFGFLKEGIVFKRQLFHYYLLLKNPIHTSTVIVNRKLIDSVGAFDPYLTIVEDRDLWIRCSKQMHVGFIPRILCKYCFEDDNVTNDRMLYPRNLSYVINKHFIKEKHTIPNCVKAQIKSNLGRLYRSLSLLNAKAGNRQCAIRASISSLRFPNSQLIVYLIQIGFALLSPRLYSRLKELVSTDMMPFVKLGMSKMPDGTESLGDNIFKY